MLYGREKSRERSGGEKPKQTQGAKKTDRKTEQENPTGSTPPSPPPSLAAGARSKYTLPPHPMAPLLSPPLLADSVTKFHAASTAVPCSGSPQRYAITGLAGAGRRDRRRCRRTRGRTGLRVEAVAAESRSSEGGVAEDYYAVLGVVGISS